MTEYRVILDPDIRDVDYLDSEMEIPDSELSTGIQLPEEELQNIIILSILLILGLSTNLVAFPVIMFRRTKFGNGQFAVLVLCLTVADVLTVSCGLTGGLVLEVGRMGWEGTSVGCSAYYFLASWLLGLSNYLVCTILSLVHVKRTTGWISRFQECKTLLLSITLATLLPALTELLIRSTITFPDGTSICIISAEPVSYGLYISFNLAVSHLLPITIVLCTLLRPQTRAAKRFSSLFLGEGSTCECGPSGEEFKFPHHCPSIGTSPDLVTSHRQICEGSPSMLRLTGRKLSTVISVREDPHRRRYKFLLSIAFIIISICYVVSNISFQIETGLRTGDQSIVSKYLLPVLYTASYAKQIINPCIFLYMEFI